MKDVKEIVKQFRSEVSSFHEKYGQMNDELADLMVKSVDSVQDVANLENTVFDLKKEIETLKSSNDELTRTDYSYGNRSNLSYAEYTAIQRYISENTNYANNELTIDRAKIDEEIEKYFSGDEALRYSTHLDELVMEEEENVSKTKLENQKRMRELYSTIAGYQPVIDNANQQLAAADSEHNSKALDIRNSFSEHQKAIQNIEDNIKTMLSQIETSLEQCNQFIIAADNNPQLSTQVQLMKEEVEKLNRKKEILTEISLELIPMYNGLFDTNMADNIFANGQATEKEITTLDMLLKRIDSINLNQLDTISDKFKDVKGKVEEYSMANRDYYVVNIDSKALREGSSSAVTFSKPGKTDLNVISRVEDIIPSIDDKMNLNGSIVNFAERETFKVNIDGTTMNMSYSEFTSLVNALNRYEIVITDTEKPEYKNISMIYGNAKIKSKAPIHVNELAAKINSVCMKAIGAAVIDADRDKLFAIKYGEKTLPIDLNNIEFSTMFPELVQTAPEVTETVDVTPITSEVEEKQEVSETTPVEENVTGEVTEPKVEQEVQEENLETEQEIIARLSQNELQPYIKKVVQVMSDVACDVAYSKSFSNIVGIAATEFVDIPIFVKTCTDLEVDPTKVLLNVWGDITKRTVITSELVEEICNKYSVVSPNRKSEMIFEFQDLADEIVSERGEISISNLKSYIINSPKGKELIHELNSSNMSLKDCLATALAKFEKDETLETEEENNEEIVENTEVIEEPVVTAPVITAVEEKAKLLLVKNARKPVIIKPGKFEQIATYGAIGLGAAMACFGSIPLLGVGIALSAGTVAGRQKIAAYIKRKAEKVKVDKVWKKYRYVVDHINEAHEGEPEYPRLWLDKDANNLNSDDHSINRVIIRVVGDGEDSSRWPEVSEEAARDFYFDGEGKSLETIIDETFNQNPDTRVFFDKEGYERAVREATDVLPDKESFKTKLVSSKVTVNSLENALTLYGGVMTKAEFNDNVREVDLNASLETVTPVVSAPQEELEVVSDIEAVPQNDDIVAQEELEEVKEEQIVHSTTNPDLTEEELQELSDNIVSTTNEMYSEHKEEQQTIESITAEPVVADSEVPLNVENTPVVEGNIPPLRIPTVDGIVEKSIDEIVQEKDTQQRIDEINAEIETIKIELQTELKLTGNTEVVVSKMKRLSDLLNEAEKLNPAGVVNVNSL